ncbi:MAG TPA: hypothetical protein VH331_18485 [Allosphingosinicella sp.]|jgi:hypothetical protein|nr:hypothetical protein [Allosphingosinicella sp.]
MAAAEGVTLMELRQAAEFDWCQMQCWVEQRREFIGFQATVFFIDDHTPSGEFTLFDCNRTELTPDHLQATLTAAYAEQDTCAREIDVFVPIRLHVSTVDWVARDNSGGEYRVSHILADGGYTTRQKLRPVALHSYSGPHGAYDIASADIVLGERAGKMLMINDDSGTQVVWVPVS